MRRVLKFLSVGGWIALGQGGAALGQLVGVGFLTEVVPPDVFGSAMLCLGFSALLLTTCTNPVLQALQSFYPEAALGAKLPALRAAGVALQRNGIVFGTVLTAIVGGASVLWMSQSWLAIVSPGGVARFGLPALIRTGVVQRRAAPPRVWAVAGGRRLGTARRDARACCGLWGLGRDGPRRAIFSELCCAPSARSRWPGARAPSRLEPDASSVLQFRQQLVRISRPSPPARCHPLDDRFADRYPSLPDS